MSKSLADLRAPRAPSRPERSLTICLNPALVAEMQALTGELGALSIPARTNDDSEQSGAAKMVKSDEEVRADEIRARMAVVLAEMADWEGELRVRATPTDGEWRRWANEHPARPEGEPGHDRDAEVAGGYCNADDLLDDLAKYAYTWNGEPLAEGDWATHFAPNTAPGDLKQAASAVVGMYESRLDFRQWRSGLSADLKRWNGSEPSAPVDSPPVSGTDGSPSSTTSTSTSSTVGDGAAGS